MIIDAKCDECGKNIKPQTKDTLFSMDNGDFCKNCYENIFCSYDY